MKTPELKKCASQVMLGETAFGDGAFGWIAGPCAIESYEQVASIAAQLKAMGIGVLRGGLYKPRSSPYTFQGLHEAGVEMMQRVKAEFGMAFISEVMDEESMRVLLPVVDAFQVGARNCQNYMLLEHIASCGKPVLLKRGFGITIDEWLSAAEYLAFNGCHEIILCERGIRTMTEVTRFTLDIGAIAYLKDAWQLPVIADPSHAAGLTNYIAPLTYGAVAAGADGLIVESSNCADTAQCDPKQQISGEALAQIKAKVERMRAAL